MREAILEGTFLDYYKKMQPHLGATDEENPAKRPQRSKEKKYPMELGDYCVKVSNEGFASIQQKSSGEVMHSVINPNQEARELYINQSRILDRVNQVDDENNLLPIVIWDVGMGAATNAMSLVHALEEQCKLRVRDAKTRSIHLVSFENDLNSLKLTLMHPECFTHIRHAAPVSILKNKFWHSKSAPLEWTLLEGDFLEQMYSAPKPDIIFYDPFSYKTNGKLWQLPTFSKLREFLGSRAVELYTYSASTAIRATVLAAGFFLAKGRGTGPKNETTIALTEHAVNGPHKSIHSENLLTKDWLLRWERSDAQIPAHISDAEKNLFLQKIRDHLQFKSC